MALKILTEILKDISEIYVFSENQPMNGSLIVPTEYDSKIYFQIKRITHFSFKPNLTMCRRIKS